MATFEQVIATAARRLGSRRGAVLQDFLTGELKDLKEDIEQLPFIPWFLLSERKYNLTTADEGRIVVPENMMTEYENGALWYIDAESRRRQLVKGNLDTLYQRYRDTGEPQAYALTNQYFRIFPIPDAVYDIEILVYEKAAPFIEGEQNVWFNNAFSFVTAALILRYVESVGDRVKAQIAASRYSTELNNLRIRHEERMHANWDYVKSGDDPDPELSFDEFPRDAGFDYI